MGQAMPDGSVTTICNNQRETPNTTINETINGITLLKKSQLYYHNVMLQDAGGKEQRLYNGRKGQPTSLPSIHHQWKGTIVHGHANSSTEQGRMQQTLSPQAPLK